jgi:hypothetical protein
MRSSLALPSTSRDRRVPSICNFANMGLSSSPHPCYAAYAPGLAPPEQGCVGGDRRLPMPGESRERLRPQQRPRPSRTSTAHPRVRASRRGHVAGGRGAWTAETCRVASQSQRDLERESAMDDMIPTPTSPARRRGVDLYGAVGGTATCRALATAFYARVARIRSCVRSFRVRPLRALSKSSPRFSPSSSAVHPRPHSAANG